MRATPRRPVLLEVEVEVEPLPLEEDWRGRRAEPVLLPTGAAIVRVESRATRRAEACMLLVDRWEANVRATVYV